MLIIPPPRNVNVGNWKEERVQSFDSLLTESRIVEP